MIRSMRLLAILLVIAVLGACTENNYFTAPSQTRPDSVQQIVLPPFAANPNYQAPIGNSEYGLPVTFYIPANFTPVYTAVTSNSSVAYITSSTMTTTQVTANDGQVRYVCTITVNFRVVNAGKTTITLTLLNAGNQHSAFSIEGVQFSEKG